MVKTGVSGLKSVDKMLNEYDELINLLPQLLGENGERTYLVAIYNPVSYGPAAAWSATSRR